MIHYTSAKPGVIYWGYDADIGPIAVIFAFIIVCTSDFRERCVPVACKCVTNGPQRTDLSNRIATVFEEAGDSWEPSESFMALCRKLDKDDQRVWLGNKYPRPRI